MMFKVCHTLSTLHHYGFENKLLGAYSGNGLRIFKDDNLGQRMDRGYPLVFSDTAVCVGSQVSIWKNSLLAIVWDHTWDQIAMRC